MPNIRNISASDALKVAQKQGYFIVRQQGSHIILKTASEKILIIPNHKKLKVGTALQIIKTLGLTKEDFLKMI